LPWSGFLHGALSVGGFGREAEAAMGAPPLLCHNAGGKARPAGRIVASGHFARNRTLTNFLNCRAGRGEQRRVRRTSLTNHVNYGRHDKLKLGRKPMIAAFSNATFYWQTLRVDYRCLWPLGNILIVGDQLVIC